MSFRACYANGNSKFYTPGRLFLSATLTRVIANNIYIYILRERERERIKHHNFLS